MHCWEKKGRILTNTSKNIAICHDFYNNSERTITTAKFLIKAVAELMNLIFMQIQLRTRSETWNGIWRGRASGSWLTGASICPRRGRMRRPSPHTMHVIGADVHQLPQNGVSHLRIEKWSCLGLIMKLPFVLQIFKPQWDTGILTRSYLLKAICTHILGMCLNEWMCRDI